MQICSEDPDKLTCTLIYLRMNWQQNKKGKLLLNTCGILFYCRNGAKSTAIKHMQTIHGSLLWFLFCLILFLTSQSTIFLVMSAISTKINMRGSREGVTEGPDPLPAKSEIFGALKQCWSKSPGKSKATKPAFNIGMIIAPPAFRCWADDGPLLVVFWFLTIHLKKGVSEFSWTSSDKISGSAHD